MVLGNFDIIESTVGSNDNTNDNAGSADDNIYDNDDMTTDGSSNGSGSGNYNILSNVPYTDDEDDDEASGYRDSLTREENTIAKNNYFTLKPLTTEKYLESIYNYEPNDNYVYY